MAKGKKKIELTTEKKNEAALERSLKEIEEHLHLIPEPTYILEIGTPIRYGNWQDAVVEEVLFDGKAYILDYTSVNNNYGNPIVSEHQKSVVKWIDARRFPQREYENFTKKDDLRLSFSNRHIGDIFSKTYHFGLNLDPEYQREHVWSIEDKVRLLDSIYSNIDIGKFVFVHLGYSGEYIYEVLDGKQRIKAIIDFFEDRFQYRGKYFSDLSNRDQDHFENYLISYAEIQNATREQKLKYFLMLNTGGRIMSEDHLSKVRQMLTEETMK